MTAADTAAPSPSLLMSLPLEVRHNIFEFAAAKNTKPKKLLRYWFEKLEVKELVAKSIADNPTGPAPRVIWGNENEVDSDAPEPAEEDSDAEDDEEADQDGEDDEDEDEDAEAEQDEDQDEEVDAGAEEVADVEEDTMEQDQDAVAQPSQTAGAQPVPTNADIAAQNKAIDADTTAALDEQVVQAQPANVGASAAAPQSTDPDAQDTQAEVDEDGDNVEHTEEDGEDNENTTAAANSTDGTAAAPPPPPAPIIRASRKWRHIPNFMRLTQCPPPAELLLASKQLNTEAKNWFYDVAILRISATNSFAHTSFFEEAFSQITDAAFSPMENIRKVEVMFVWDTTWLRADETGFAAAVFPALLRQRAEFVFQILSQAPDLREVVVHYHDSAQDDESMGFMLDVLAPFHGLNATVKIEEHYIAVDAKPRKSSIAGKQRVQFQQIVDAGLERLF